MALPFSPCIETCASQLRKIVWAQIQVQVFLSAVFLVITLFSQEPDPPEAVLPLQAAAAAMWRDCHAKSYAEYSDLQIQSCKSGEI